MHIWATYLQRESVAARKELADCGSLDSLLLMPMQMSSAFHRTSLADFGFRFSACVDTKSPFSIPAFLPTHQSRKTKFRAKKHEKSKRLPKHVEFS